MPLEKWDALTKAEKRKFTPIVPDFILELRSPNDILKPIQEKIAEFIECGCRLAWLIDPTEQQTTVYRADGSQSVIACNQILSGESVLRGFEVKLAELLE